MAEYDVITVGAGILGLATAYHLKTRNPTREVPLVKAARRRAPPHFAVFLLLAQTLP
jgi:L-2-hydroxyglutarate oxidase LhgO